MRHHRDPHRSKPQSARIAILADQFRAVGQERPVESTNPPLGHPSRLANGEGLRRALQDVLDLLLKRAPVEAGTLLQTLDGL
jgi:hypothetical protein